MALAERALLAARVGNQDLAEELSRTATEVMDGSHVEDAPARALEQATAAQMLLHRGRWNEARACLDAAQALLPQLTLAIPWLAVQTRIELGRGFVTLRDSRALEELLDEIDGILERAPGLETLAAAADELAARGRCRPRAWGRRDGPDPGRVAPPSASCDSPFLPPDRGAAVRLAEHDQDAGDLRLPQARRIEPQRRGRRGSASRARRAPSRAHLGQEVSARAEFTRRG